MLLPLLERGIAVHHSGMLPVLREVVEILFQEGLVRLLFATETFSMGVNMPARTVIFTSLRKWDGVTHRAPSAAEYIQMSGRAGRRGIDERGMVILMLTEPLEVDELHTMMRDEALPLSSSFRLRYNTLLRLYSMESLQPEALISKSFYAYQRQAELPELHRRRDSLRAEAELLSPSHTPSHTVSHTPSQTASHTRAEPLPALTPLPAPTPLSPPISLSAAAATEGGGVDGGGGIEGDGGVEGGGRGGLADEAQLAELFELSTLRETIDGELAALAFLPKRILRFLQPGRLVSIGAEVGRGVQGAGCRAQGAGSGVQAGGVRAWGVVLGYRHVLNRYISDDLVQSGSRADFVIDLLLPCAPGTAARAAAAAASGERFTPLLAPLANRRCEGHVVPVSLEEVRQLSAARLWLPTDLLGEEGRHSALAAMRQLLCIRARLGRAEVLDAACLHPVHHVGDTSEATITLSKRREALVTREAHLVWEIVGEIVGEVHTGRADGGDGSEGDDDGSESDGDGGGDGDGVGDGNGGGDGDGDGGGDGGGDGDGAGAEDGEIRQHASRRPSLRPVPSLRSQMQRYARKRALQKEASECDAQAGTLGVDDFAGLMSRMRVVLRRLGHVDGENVVLLKGRAAAEVEACDELLAAELILNGTFNDLSAGSSVALCSTLIAADMEKSKRFTPPHTDVAAAYLELQSAARRVAAVLNEANITTDETEFVAKFDGGLINLVHAWASGCTFDELCGMSDLFEGSIIRAIRRLSELLDELQSAAKAIGNEELYLKLKEGSRLIQRDIVFASSLYIEG